MKLSLFVFGIMFCFLQKDKEAFSGISSNDTIKVYKDSLVTNFFQRTTGCIAGDGGFSVPLTNGKVIWLMGDSHIDDYNIVTQTVPCLFQVRNTAMLQPLNDWTSQNTITLKGTSKGIPSFFKNNSNDTFFCWPAAGLQLGDTAYVYCMSLKNQGHGAFGFATAGNDFFAKIKIPEMKVVGFAGLPDFKGLAFGNGFIKSDDGKWVYAYGQKYTGREIKCQLYVARFPINNPLSAWEYWNGNNWEENISDAKEIATQTGVSATFQVSKIKNKILLLSSQLSINCDSGTEIYAATSNDITGPFTSKKMIYGIDDKKEGHTPFFYSAIAHPEYINNKDELLLTYAINGFGTCVTDCNNNRMDPNVYRLRGIRVPCKLFND